MPRTKTYQIRMDEEEKHATFQVFHDLGITPAEAIRLFFAKVRTTQSIPFSIEYTPNAKTAQVLLASDSEKDYQGFNNLDDLFHDLED